MSSERHDINNDIIGTVRILIADDHPLMRLALKQVIGKEPNLVIIGEAEDGEEAVRKTVELVPDVVIMDISMPRLNGLEATRRIKEKCPKVAILVLTVHTEREHIFAILDAGAAGYLTKKVFGNEVIQSILSVAAGETTLSPEISRELIKQCLRYPVKPLPLDKFEKLTVRELEVLNLTAQGMSNKEIAKTLNLSLRTIKGHVSDILSKLRAGSRTEATMIGIRTGLIKSDSL